MLLIEKKCGKCGHRFEAEVLDRETPEERQIQGAPLRCPNCNSTMLERVRVIRRLLPRKR
jgi:DNA-directed RNA polymerase subunit RPC12/RpoP